MPCLLQCLLHEQTNRFWKTEGFHLICCLSGTKVKQMGRYYYVRHFKDTISASNFNFMTAGVGS